MKRQPAIAPDMVQREHWQRLRPCRLIATASDIPSSRPVRTPTVKADGGRRRVEVSHHERRRGCLSLHDLKEFSQRRSARTQRIADDVRQNHVEVNPTHFDRHATESTSFCQLTGSLLSRFILHQQHRSAVQRQRRIAGQTRFPELAHLNFLRVRLNQCEHVCIEAAQLFGDPIPTGELASASPDRTLKVWDTVSGQDTLTLKGHTDWITSATFSADGKRLVSASGDHTVKVWDARPWTPELRAEQEALSLIHWLRDQGQAQTAWLDTIAANQTLSPPVRDRAMQFAREWK